MFKTQQGYVFETFRDGKVIFYHDSYEKHCGYRSILRGEEGRNNIQDALITPHYITSYSEMSASGRLVARYKIYRTIIREIRTSRGRELEYWEILLKKNPKNRRKIATAYITSAPEYAIINNRIEKNVEYKRQFRK
ncbi:MAG: hypothetical protein KJI72_03860 [Patescibacteria group bacterium]|nr:hypothetical protein [Patescibacteria group bacterium]